MVDENHVHLTGCLGDVEDWIGQPVDAGHRFPVESHFLPERTAHALDDIAFDAFHQPVGIDDLSTVVGHGELAREDLAGRAIDIDFGDLQEELRQLESNRRYWDKRLTALETELLTEPDRIRELYDVKATRIEPVGLVYLWPVTG